MERNVIEKYMEKSGVWTKEDVETIFMERKKCKKLAVQEMNVEWDLSTTLKAKE